jgi:hypothetical protein
VARRFRRRAGATFDAGQATVSFSLPTKLFFKRLANQADHVRQFTKVAEAYLNVAIAPAAQAGHVFTEPLRITESRRNPYSVKVEAA